MVVVYIYIYGHCKGDAAVLPNRAVWQQERRSRLGDASLSVTAMPQQLTQSVAMFGVHYSARLSAVSCVAISFTILVGAKILYSTNNCSCSDTA